MKLLEYLQTDDKTLARYIDERLVDMAEHDTFPLVMFTYNRKCTYDHVWDNITRRCRGLIVNRDTEEIVARPFEKFFNLGTAGMPETEPVELEMLGEPAIYEKMDGFLCTMYEWEGKQYIASKGSFHSVHAKWATAWYQKNVRGEWPAGFTPVFEGITPSIRIVVDYGKFEGLVLLGLVNTETGAELNGHHLNYWASVNHLRTPGWHQHLTLDAAHSKTLDTTVKNDEGFIACWYKLASPPMRVKIKYVDYLRIHRLVTCTTPKRIFEALAGEGWDGGLDALVNDTTPWFNAYVAKWKNYLETQFNTRSVIVHGEFDIIRSEALAAAQEGEIWTRKQWATRFQQIHKDYWSSLFALLDGKDVRPVIWKQIKPLIRNGKPLVDARFV